MYTSVAEYFASDPTLADLVEMLDNPSAFWSRVANNTILDYELKDTMSAMEHIGRTVTSATYRASEGLLLARELGLVSQPVVIEGE